VIFLYNDRDDNCVNYDDDYNCVNRDDDINDNGVTKNEKWK
jgi:hypothetical protein